MNDRALAPSFLLVATASTLAALVSGCPSSSTSSITEAEFSSQIGPAACAAVDTCLGPAVSQIFLGPAGGCDVAFIAPYENVAEPLLEAASARGTVVFDSAAARACLDALRASPCSLTNNGTAAVACQDVYVGMQPAGGACALHEECGVEQFCSFASACPGTCQARRTAGQDCSEERSCAPGLTCVDSTCQAPPMVGAGCTELGECGLGLLCASGRCAPAAETFTGAEGATCNLMGGPLCQEGLSCVVDTVAAGGATFVCRAAVASGAPCRLGLPAQCPAGEGCAETNPMRLDFDGVCAPLPATDGEPCDLSGCAEGLRCDDGACVAVRDNGQACDRAEQCVSALCTGGVCVAPTLCGE